MIEGMGHGTPIDPGAPDRVSKPLPYMLAADLSSTMRIGQAFVILGGALENTHPQQQTNQQHINEAA
jgi:hypothetical protein